eukprot:1624449-Rhodomonas_salina.1
MMNVSSSLRERQQNDMVRIQELEAEVRHAALLSSTRGWEVGNKTKGEDPRTSPTPCTNLLTEQRARTRVRMGCGCERARGRWQASGRWRTSCGRAWTTCAASRTCSRAHAQPPPRPTRSATRCARRRERRENEKDEIQ